MITEQQCVIILQTSADITMPFQTCLTGLQRLSVINDGKMELKTISLGRSGHYRSK